MKKKKLVNKLEINKRSIAKLDIRNIMGGYVDNTKRDCISRFQTCSDINCYTDNSCYKTETCDNPVVLTVIGCETQPPNC
ncbi:class I lanthipeptide [uncultured Kordia sp.]|uniref:class I lanthipeptide n=1 Tax=uncultured Kordia sp. TaxID=507699 RepID=UPI00260C26E5|nr:class I lanthipeptide [uncultured Kordia sp.]